MWIVMGMLAWPLVEIGLFVTLGAALGLWFAVYSVAAHQALRRTVRP